VYEEQDERRMEHLVGETAARVVDPILRRIVNPPSADVREEIRAEVLLRLVARLRMADGGRAEQIESLADYAAVVTYHAHADHLRRLFPGRAKLKDHLRYVFARDARFQMESASEGMICRLVPAAAGSMAGNQAAEILAAHGGTMEVDALLDILVASRIEAAPPPVADDSQPMHLRVEHLQLVARVWKEIGELPVRQRIALLLNLLDVDGDPVVFLFPVTSVATMRQIAEAVEMKAEEFAALWNRLPLEDAEIALLLGVTRQQVINLRKSARERLTRRMAGSL
jgi:predicted DNA-binding protein (UPF0251 family)